jgi:hypothetical protein
MAQALGHSDQLSTRRPPPTLNVPAGHSSHCIDPTGRYDPATHGTSHGSPCSAGYTAQIQPRRQTYRCTRRVYDYQER